MWLRRLPFASPLGFGHLARVPAWAGLRRGLPVRACCHFPPPRQAWLPVSRAWDAGPPSEDRGLARSPAGRQPGRWRASSQGRGPSWGLGKCQMVFRWAVLPVRLVGRGAVRVSVRPVPGPADGPPGPTCWVLLDRGDWGSRWECWRKGAWCRGVLRSGRWWRQSG